VGVLAELSTIIPPVGDAVVGAERFCVPLGVKLLLNVEGMVTSKDMTQPLPESFVQPSGVPAKTLKKMESTPVPPAVRVVPAHVKLLKPSASAMLFPPVPMASAVTVTTAPEEVALTPTAG
jgi:hypothetical protein